jgi:integrase/recombinase XerD
MSNLHEEIDNYLSVRRSLGYKLKRAERFLHDFASFLEQSGSATITTDLAVEWAMRPTNADQSWWAARLRPIRVFAKHQHAIDPLTEIPPDDILTQQSRRAEPYLYTEDEIVALQQAARTIRPPLGQVTYETLIGLLAVTGVRVGEAINLDCDDVDWSEGLILVRQAKFNKTRRLPLHPSTMDALRHYQQIRNKRCLKPSTAAFFVSTTGTRLLYENVQRCFHALTQQVGIVARNERCRPRIHDLRHRFAVTTLIHWYRDGYNVDAELPKLSTYLGHASPSSTYWYLTATPELMGLAAQRLEAARGLMS